MIRFRVLLVLAAASAALAGAPRAAHAQACVRGSYFFPPVSVAAGTYAIESAIADFDNDGKLDLAVVSFSDNTVRLYKGNGDGTFVAMTTLTVTGSPHCVAAADLDHDGSMDFVVATTGSSSVVIHRNTGSFTFAAGTPISVGSPARGLRVLDLDGDGILDIATATETGLSVLKGTGSGGVWNGSFGPLIHVNSPWLWHIDAGDLDGDGQIDIVGASSSTSIQVFYNTAGSFTATGIPVGLGQGDVAIADVNGDGKKDIVAANDNLPVLLNQGSRTYTLKTSSDPSLFNGLAVADVDGDGYPDALGVNGNTYKLDLLLGRGDGTFQAVDPYATGNGPAGISLADLNGDGGIDAVVANTGTNNVSVFLTKCTGPQAPTVLSFSPTAGQIGDPVTINGTTFGGTTQVKFNGTPSSFTVMNAGQISTTVPVGATSGPISVTNAQGTGQSGQSFTVGVRPTVDSAIPTHAKRGQFVQIAGQHFTGTTRVRFGAAGSAPFHLDSDNGLTVQLDSLATTGPVSVTTGIGTGTSAFTFTVDPLDTIPHIASVRDVPNDQGGHVFVRWSASDLDVPGKRVITGYRVWRRTPLTMANAASRARIERNQVTGEFWEALATLPVSALGGYAYTAPTTQDSLPGGNPFTAFFVQALTADPFVWYSSAPDSGYSVDNLSPPQPQPFVGSFGPSAVALHWGPSPAADFAEFRLHRGNSALFVPGPTNLVAATSDTGYTDPGSHTGNVYKLAAVDIHGNVSHYAVVTIDGPTAALISLVSADGSGGSARLRWYSAGNPGLAARLERSTGADWTALATLVADGSGYLEYEDRAVSEGDRYGYRLTILNGDRESSFGETWLVIATSAAGLQMRLANPMRSAALEMDVVLAGTDPARIEVLDVAGRRLIDQRLDGLGPGSHHLQLGRSPGGPGLVLLRLSQAGQVRIARAVLLR